MSDVVIRKAEAEDIPLLLDFIKMIAEYEKLPHEVTATENDLFESFFGENAKTEGLLAFDNSVPVAYAIYFTNFSSFLGKQGIYLEDIFVKPEMRGKGIGKKLLKLIAKTAIERNAGRLEWIVLDWNKPAIDFYESIGAFPLEGWTLYRLTGDKLKEFAGN
ncbi:MAG: GNAT family N-acetyltransferase [Ignavibacteriaceae bacterium]|nr:GNAT family N-acetyltransferase [Ignavibacteriaceae bacterium]